MSFTSRNMPPLPRFVSDEFLFYEKKAATKGSARRQEALEALELIATADAHYALRMCILHYCSPCFVSDAEEAARWAIAAKRMGNADADRWLRFLLMRPEPPSGVPEADPGGRRLRVYPAPWLEDEPALGVLLDILRYGAFASDHISYGPRSGLFKVDSYGWKDGHPCSNLMFDPLGLEVVWPRGRLSEATMNIPLSPDGLRRILLVCIGAMVENSGRRRA